MSEFSAIARDLEGQGTSLSFTADQSTLTVGEVYALWQNEPAFSEFFSDVLARLPMDAFRWETPALVRAGLNRPFECVLLPSPTLARQSANPRPFAAQLESAEKNDDVISFKNLGGDAELIVPRALDQAADYAHLAAFLRTAPSDQKSDLWREVARAVEGWLPSGDPFWVSTAGLGVAWLHVRIDTRPKYYAHACYREIPQ